MDGIKKQGDKLILSTKEIIELLDISDRTLTDWKRQGLAQHSRGWWDLKLVLKWRGMINSSGSGNKSVNLQQKKLEAEVAFKEAQSELTRLKTDIANGKYIDKELVEAELSRFFVIFKKSAMSLPRKLVGEIGTYVEPIEARRIEKSLSDAVNDALEQMSVDGVYHAKKRK
jgi:phage terminase Nu1 subunit (DNA packaging protein)